MAPKKTRLQLVAAAHLPSSQGSCAAFLREGNIVGRHGWTWSSRFQPGRPACPAYAASPPPPRPAPRSVRSVPPALPAAPQRRRLEGSAARRNTPAGLRDQLDVTKKAASSPHSGQGSPNELSTAGPSTSGIRSSFLLFPRESWQHGSIPVSPEE